MIILSKELLKELEDTLNFYASQRFYDTIRNVHGTNFQEEKARLFANGFQYLYECYNGDEVYIESGQRAQNILLKLEDLIYEHEERYRHGTVQ